MPRKVAPRVRLFHWRSAEAAPLVKLLEDAGYEVHYPGDKENGSLRWMTEAPTHAAVIDLTRMPSHGRYMAAEIRGRKSTSHIPIVFVDGAEDKIEKIRLELPDAVYTTRAKLIAALKKVKPLTNPVPAKPMMLTYADRTTAQKLGIASNTCAAVIDPPASYAKIIGTLPEGAWLEEDPGDPAPITLWFVRDEDTYLAGLRLMRARATKSRLWVIYPKGGPKKGTTGITQFMIREAALSVGLVDYKICSVDTTWSGMLFTIKKK